MPVRVMKLLGCSHLIITNAAGGLNPDYNVGDIMVIKDHVNFMGLAGNNPLQGPNEERFGPRFPAMSRAYDKELREKAKFFACCLGMQDSIREGVYSCLGGPNFETIAELKMLRMCGVDAVGMSTVHEVIVARHCDMTVFAFSLITNSAIMDYEESNTIKHEDVLEMAKLKEEQLKRFITEMVGYIGTTICL